MRKEELGEGLQRRPEHHHTAVERALLAERRRAHGGERLDEIRREEAIEVLEDGDVQIQVGDRRESLRVERPQPYLLARCAKAALLEQPPAGPAARVTALASTCWPSLRIPIRRGRHGCQWAVPREAAVRDCAAHER
eukprot:1203039-Prymnesium_polylepis.2